VPGAVRQGEEGVAAQAARSVLNVWPWLPGILAQWAEEARPQMRHASGSRALWPSERGGRIGLEALDRRFAAYRVALGLDDGIDFHSLRHILSA
jgi:integrase/recombinase XerC